MRPIILAAVALLCLDAAAQSPARPRPPGTTPLEAPPPMPAPAADAKDDPALAPQVTTVVRDGETVQEYRLRGKLYMVRVTPRSGRAYVMVDNKGDGTFTRQDNTLDNGVRVPQWVLLEW